MTQIKEEFEIIKEDLNEKRIADASLQKFIDGMASVNAQIKSLVNKPAFDLGANVYTNFLLWQIWSELIRLQNVILKAEEKTYIPNTEVVK